MLYSFFFGLLHFRMERVSVGGRGSIISPPSPPQLLLFLPSHQIWERLLKVERTILKTRAVYASLASSQYPISPPLPWQGNKSSRVIESHPESQSWEVARIYNQNTSLSHSKMPSRIVDTGLCPEIPWDKLNVCGYIMGKYRFTNENRSGGSGLERKGTQGG